VLCESTLRTRHDFWLPRRQACEFVTTLDASRAGHGKCYPALHIGPTLNTSLAGLPLKSPVILAAGTCGYLDEMADVLDLSRVGAVVTKSITRLSREGNATWRILECRAGMLNAIGLANVGLDAFMRDYAPKVAGVPTAVIGSIAGFSVEDYTAVAAAFNGIEAMAAVELNVSCPNVHGGTEFGLDPGALRELIAAVRAALTRKPLLVKLSPVAAGTPGHSMVDLARAAVEAGAQILCLANTTPAMAIDVRTRRPRLANVTGGLSGPAVHPIAVKLVHDVYRAVAKPAGVPIVGIGGVLTWEDAAEFVLAGASAVEIGTGLFADPKIPLRVVKGLEKWVREQGRSGMGALVGAVELPEKR
jgi:dihydroorotate dehydrogenase (NAD+) catalytic subunit